MRVFNGLERADYQNLSRAIGRECDRQQPRDLRLVEQPGGLLIQVTRHGRLPRGFHTFHLSNDLARRVALNPALEDRLSDIGGRR